MSAIIVRNIPSEVHEALRHMAAERGQPVETLVRDLLSEAAHNARPAAIDFEQLEKRRKELGVASDGPPWTDALDSPALSRRVLGMKS